MRVVHNVQRRLHSLLVRRRMIDVGARDLYEWMTVFDWGMSYKSGDGGQAACCSGSARSFETIFWGNYIKKLEKAIREMLTVLEALEVRVVPQPCMRTNVRWADDVDEGPKSPN